MIPALGFDVHSHNDYVNARVSKPVFIRGGGGDDILNGGSAGDDIDGLDGNDYIDGRDGADDMAGHGGNDTVTYASRTPSVFVDIDGDDDDGRPGEGDNVRLTVENVIGSKSGD